MTTPKSTPALRDKTPRSNIKGWVHPLDTLKRAGRTERANSPRTRWGAWEYRPRTLELVFMDPYDVYAVDLERMTDSAEMLDWIFQIRKKTWATPQVVSDFLEALRDLLNPQRNYCPGGTGHAVDVRTLLREKPATALTEVAR